ncbi:MAG: NAD-glutamate dehydrogenase [Legionellales bacterium]|nr:NAD-glutamate dehydrogenase [Legionellales bacterium]
MVSGVAVMSQKELTIAKVIQTLTQQMGSSQASLISQFTQQFYATVAEEDLCSFSENELYGLMVSLWSFLTQRNPAEIKIRIYNPRLEHDGWQSTHTIVEISSKDMPFLVDSSLMEITRQGYSPHFIMHSGGIHFKRDAHHQIQKVLLRNGHHHEEYEAVLHFQIDKETDEAALNQLKAGLMHALNDVREAVEDWQLMKKRMSECVEALNQLHSNHDPEDITEAKDFLNWLIRDHFTFIGCRDYQLVGEGENQSLNLVPGTGLGVLRNEEHSTLSRVLANMPSEARKQILSKQVLMIAKTNTLSTVHRRAYTDYIGVKLFDKQGKFVGERRFIGLYTSTAYNTSPKHIPLLRGKVAKVMMMSGLLPTGHAAKALLNILETLPRDDLFQASVDELYELSLGIYHLYERKRVKLYVRKDIYDRFFSCLVYVPRDRFSTYLRENIQKILLRAFQGSEVSFTTQFSDSLLARIHFVVRVNADAAIHYDIKSIEQEIIAITRTWSDDFNDLLIERYGEERGNELITRYKNAFPSSYQETFSPQQAVVDVTHIESLAKNSLSMSVYRSPIEDKRFLHFKLFQANETFELSNALPIFENMGLRVLWERPHRIEFQQDKEVWINDFNVTHDQGAILDVDAVKELFQECFAAVWTGDAENDGFNRLVLTARVSWRDVVILRAYAKYLRQIGFTFSQAYIEQALSEHALIAGDLIGLFKLLFEPSTIVNREETVKRLLAKITLALDEVASLDEDRIIRRYLEVIQATYRTNFFQTDANNQAKSYVSFKLNSRVISDIPQPAPCYEIFVYSPQFEGVHLRMAKVARGGIRWSDRREDFRTEILGLMKAQQVKNAVIVPQGAKGGFVPKLLPADATREELMEIVIHCYQNFIRGLLDITDNLINHEVVKPPQVICYDDDDPYLVVAADKGTATFSDIANQIAQEYQFWLGDAFASGGGQGYDHKKMGITARGAWESVKRNFRELNLDVATTDFDVVGIGDMSGDVFGNGMLLSPHIRLIGAFNHIHIFIDPNPDSAQSFQERQRLFHLPRSTWEDYNPNLISTGGGVFKRSAKYIKVTAAMKERLDIVSDYVTPQELIRYLLKARVDLLWNGGIGTYVKASHEIHADVGDRANDAIRVNANELRARVIAEGGNLGLTQASRVEYSLNGGICFTDFIDNSAGVDCSDHEVNIKILLNTVVANGDLTEKQRNQLLAEMGDEVAKLVLRDNYEQTLAISRAAEQAVANLDLYADYINDLEQKSLIDRKLEYLPDHKAFIERKNDGKGFTRPEIAVLLAYSKNILKQQLLDTDLPEDDNLQNMLEKAFPDVLRERFLAPMRQHSLRREIIATQLSNTILNEMGLTFVARLQDESGASQADIVRAYMMARRIFKLTTFNHLIIALENNVNAQVQSNLLFTVNRLIRRVTRWILRNRPHPLNIATGVEYFLHAVDELQRLLPTLLQGVAQESFNQQLSALQEQGVPDAIAEKIVICNEMYSAMDIIEGAKTRGFTLETFAKAYYAVGEYLHLDWLRTQISSLKVSNRWEALSRSHYRDDIDSLQRTLTSGVLLHSDNTMALSQQIEDWYHQYQEMVDRWQQIMTKMRLGKINYTMMYVVIRAFFDMALAAVENLPNRVTH